MNHPPLGTSKYQVRYLKPSGRIRSCILEVENNSMATTNLVYDFFKRYPHGRYKIMALIRIEPQ